MTGTLFDRVVIMILENHGYDQVAGCRFVDWFAKNGVTFTNWRGVAHPSGPNYRAMFSGNTWSGNEFDGARRPNVADTVPMLTVAWKGVPADRHNPAKDMHAIHATFANAAVLRTFSNILTPDTGIVYLGMDDDNDAHNGNLELGDRNVMEAIGSWSNGDFGPPAKTLLAVTFDEAFGVEWQSNHVFMGMAGCGATPGNRKPNMLDHYSFSKMLYTNWGVPPHGAEQPAAVCSFL
jgi:hypothetical protein